MKTATKLTLLLLMTVCSLSAGCGRQPRSTGGANPDMSLSSTGGSSDVSSTRFNLTKANLLYRQGLDFYLKGRPGSPNSNANLNQAVKNFRAAVSIYEKASSVDPENGAIQNRIQDCNMKIYACGKMMTL